MNFAPSKLYTADSLESYICYINQKFQENALHMVTVYFNTLRGILKKQTLKHFRLANKK